MSRSRNFNRNNFDDDEVTYFHKKGDKFKKRSRERESKWDDYEQNATQPVVNQTWRSPRPNQSAQTVRPANAIRGRGV